MSGFLQRLAVKYLRKHGWIIFWLDKENQFCSARDRTRLDRVCWLHEYLRCKDLLPVNMRKPGVEQ